MSSIDVVDDDHVALERTPLVVREAALARLVLEQAVDRLRRRARRFAHSLGGPPRGRGQQHLALLGLEDFAMLLTIVVLPTPRPPVMTEIFDVSAVLIALRCAAASSTSVFCCTQTSALSMSIGRKRERRGTYFLDLARDAALGELKTGQVNVVVLDDNVTAERQQVDRVLHRRHLDIEQFPRVFNQPLTRQPR